MDKVIQTYEIARQSFKKYGKHMQFPKNCEPSKTYEYRHISNFINLCNKDKIDEKLIPMIIDKITEEASKQGTISKGLTILNRHDILDIAIKTLEEKINKEKTKVSKVLKSYKYIQKMMEEKNYKTQYEALSHRVNKYGNINMIDWLLSGHIYIDIIPISKSCRQTLGDLNDLEKTYIPSAIDLLRLKIRLLIDQETVKKLSELMGPDFCK